MSSNIHFIAWLNSISKLTEDSVVSDVHFSFALTFSVFSFDDFDDYSIGSFDDTINVAAVIVTVVAALDSFG